MLCSVERSGVLNTLSTRKIQIGCLRRTKNRVVIYTMRVEWMFGSIIFVSSKNSFVTISFILIISVYFLPKIYIELKVNQDHSCLLMYLTQ